MGFKLTGALKEGATATDAVLTVTEMLRKKGVVGKFVEFYGPGVSTLPLADRATIANMAPEYGATIGFFPVDEQTLKYLELTNRPPEHHPAGGSLPQRTGAFPHRPDRPDPEFADTLSLDLSTVEPSLAGPKRPQDRITLKNAKTAWRKFIQTSSPVSGYRTARPRGTRSLAMTGN